MSPVIDLRDGGPSEARWASVCDTLPPFSWPTCTRVVVVSPHPDDETLGAGGLIGVALERGLQVLVVSVTDGEAASPVPDLARRRRSELARALACLDPAGRIRHLRFGIADSQVAAVLDELTDAIAEQLRPTDLVVGPLPDDGHPDHGATSAAARRAADRAGSSVRWFPIWAWHCHDPDSSAIVGGQRLVLPDDVLRRKRRAVRCFASQIVGPTPVVPPSMIVRLVRLVRPFEVLVPHDPFAEA